LIEYPRKPFVQDDEQHLNPPEGGRGHHGLNTGY
jgi:hypothetical protein